MTTTATKVCPKHKFAQPIPYTGMENAAEHTKCPKCLREHVLVVRYSYERKTLEITGRAKLILDDLAISI